ncbi:hypothetical protein BKA70DRAFT_577719 [Coprinopsis sp. MPI-PUGE-AT-0042]|nr:hypothetical protein BKA70DRAFT_577719 [Coprinopsis sp. MPI-PUGE-AT-0042]
MRFVVLTCTESCVSTYLSSFSILFSFVSVHPDPVFALLITAWCRFPSNAQSKMAPVLRIGTVIVLTFACMVLDTADLLLHQGPKAWELWLILCRTLITVLALTEAVNSSII